MSLFSLKSISPPLLPLRFAASIGHGRHTSLARAAHQGLKRLKSGDSAREEKWIQPLRHLRFLGLFFLFDPWNHWSDPALFRLILFYESQFKKTCYYSSIQKLELQRMPILKGFKRYFQGFATSLFCQSLNVLPLPQFLNWGLDFAHCHLFSFSWPIQHHQTHPYHIRRSLPNNSSKSHKRQVMVPSRSFKLFVYSALEPEQLL